MNEELKEQLNDEIKELIDKYLLKDFTNADAVMKALVSGFTATFMVEATINSRKGVSNKLDEWIKVMREIIKMGGLSER